MKDLNKAIATVKDSNRDLESRLESGALLWQTGNKCRSALGRLKDDLRDYMARNPWRYKNGLAKFETETGTFLIKEQPGDQPARVQFQRKRRKIK